MVFHDKNPNEEGDDSYAAGGAAEGASHKSTESSERISSMADLGQSSDFPPTGSNSSEDVGREVMDHSGFEIPGVLDGVPLHEVAPSSKAKKSRAVDGPPYDITTGKDPEDNFRHVGVPVSPTEDEFSSILKDIGDFGPYQWFIAFVNILMTITAGIQNNSYPMIVGSSTAWEYDCVPIGASNYTMLPETQSCSASVSVLGETDSTSRMVECYKLQDHEMVYQHEHFEKTVTTEFHLMCGYKTYIAPLVHSAFTIGCFFGVLLFGWLSDWLGRKKALCIGIPVMIVLNFGLGLSPNIQVFLAIRLLQGCAVFGVFTVVYVISMETTSPSKRAMIGNIVHVPWGLQFITVSLIAMAVKDWRLQQVYYSLPSLLCLLCCIPFFKESPRWLIINGKIGEATKVFMQGARLNGKKVSEASIQERLDKYYKSSVAEKEPEDGQQLKLVVGLVKTPEMRRRFLFSAVIWFQGAFTNHGLNFYAPTLADNPFMAYCLVGIFEFLSPLIGALVFTYGRRKPLIVLYAICTLTAFAIIPVLKIWPDDHHAQLLVLILMGTFLSDMAFNGIYVHVSEFMPTTHRSTGLGSCSAVARIGSTMSSFIVESAKSYPALPAIIFGSISLLGSVCTYMLPSTEGKTLPETIDEVEQSARRGEGSRGFEIFSSHNRSNGSTSLAPARLKNNTVLGATNDDHVNNCNSCDKRIKRHPGANGFCHVAMIENVTCV